jgi:hypothetical protein
MSKNVKKKSVVVVKDLFDRMDLFFENHQKWIFWLTMGFSLLFSLLLFSLKMSEMGDDSGYVLRAFKLLKEGDYPTFQGPFYPMFLSLFVAVFGVKIVLFKGLSLVFILLALYFFFRSLQGRVPYSLLMPVFILTAVNSYILYFASQTFSEAPYLLLQAMLYYVLFKKDSTFQQDFEWKADWKHYLLIGLLLFLGGLTRSVHLGALAAVLVFFLLIGKWRSALAALGGYGIFWAMFELIKRLFWHNNSAQISSQGHQMLLKDPYNPQQGMEQFSGFIGRFVDNSQYYISNSFFMQTGLRGEADGVNAFLTLLFYGLVLLGLYLVFKKNKPLLFNILYIGAICLVTFFGLQAFWSQWRLIGIFYPFLLLAFLTAFYYGLKRFPKLQFVYPLLLIVMLFAELGDTFKKTEKNIPVLKENMAGNTFADYAPEWKSYMEMSQWAAKEVPADYTIASRKPEMSFIYTGRVFYGIYNVPEVNMDTLKARIKPDRVLLGFDPSQLAQVQVFEQIRKDVLCFVQGTDNSFVGVYQMTAAKAESILPLVKAAQVPVDQNVMQTLNAKVASGVQMHVTDPELLVKEFVDNDIRYVILNSPNLFSTLYRYLSFIQFKYPRSLSLVHTIGQQPAHTSLVQFNQEQLN